MPIKACADKLRQEIAEFGNPPRFPEETPEAIAAAKRAAEEAAAEAAKQQQKGNKKQQQQPKKQKGGEAGGEFHGRKAKVSQKTVKRQWNILLSNGVAAEDIPRFVDPLVWLAHFPPLGQQDLRLMGVAVDWRRSFITTDVNKFYDSFVRWQFETLHDLGLVEFGKRYTIYSPLDGQACADHERTEGETVMPQDYTLIKMEVVKGHADVPAKLRPLLEANRRIFLVAGTLRPETMYGQVCCWAQPEGAYGVFEVSENEAWVCSARAARNMAFQGLSRVPEKASCICEITGQELMGTPLNAPLAQYPVVHVLPMLTINPEKSTGIVTCVPSDSPDDWINFHQLQAKPEYRKKLGIRDEWVMPFKIIPIIRIPELGDCAAETVCAELKIKGPNDHDLLEQAKEKTYMRGFYQGEMIIGPHSGMKVKDAKPLVRDELLAAGLAAPYSEPASRVVSRSGDECVVALVDQWYIKYGEANWRAKAEERVQKMELYHPATKDILMFALGWMNQWACSRNFGLGTRLPWDEKYLIESLSDSTIYMAYYTIAHLIQGGTLDAAGTNAAGVRPEQMTRGVWDHIFLGKPAPADCTIAPETLALMCREFQYWYPLDLRVSGKDLLQNHLLFSIYNHAAIWPDELGPRAFRANGHLLLNGDKMAKSTGNFLTLREGVEAYSADGMRIALADAGDGVDDANFVVATADSALLRLFTQLQWIEETLKTPLSDEETMTAYDRIFASSVAKAVEEADRSYSRAMYRDALVHAFFELQAARDLYRSTCETLGVQMKRMLVMRFIEVQAIVLSPIAPHFADHVWRNVLHREGFVWSHARWPTELAGTPDAAVLERSEYIERVLTSFRIVIRDYLTPKKAKKAKKAGAAVEQVPPPTEAEIVLANAFPEWTTHVCQIIARLHAAKGEFPTVPEALAAFNEDPVLKTAKEKAMGKLRFIQEDFAKRGPVAFSLQLSFDERAQIEENIEYIRKSLALTTLTIRALEGVDEKIVPGAPGFFILK